jgi:hypothetical protein
MKPESKQKKYNERCRIAVDLIANNPDILNLLKDKYTTDDILEDALELNPDIFKFIKEPSMRIILKALDMDGGNIQYLDKEVIDSLSDDVLVAAIDTMDVNTIISDIDFESMSEETRVDIFVNDPIKALQCGVTVPEYFIIKELQKSPNLIRYVKNPTNRMKYIALENDPNVAVYFDSLTDEMMDIIDSKYPHLKNLPTYTRGKEGGVSE